MSNRTVGWLLLGVGVCAIAGWKSTAFAGPGYGMYQNMSFPELPRLSFRLIKSKNPDQATVYGTLDGRKIQGVRMRGTYYFKRNSLVAFGEVPGEEEKYDVKFTGKYQGGQFD